MNYQFITKLFATNVSGVEFSHDDSLVAICGESVYIGTIGGKELYKGTFRNDYEKFYYNLIPEHFKNLTMSEVKWSPDDKYLYGIAGGEVYRFSVERQDFKRFFAAGSDSSYSLKCLTMNEKKQVLVVAGQGGEKGKEDTVFVIDFSGKLLFSFQSKHGQAVNSVLFTPDGTKIVTTGKDYFLRVWNAENGALLGEIEQKVRGALTLWGFLDDNTMLVNSEPYPAFAIDVAGKVSLVTNYEGVLPKQSDLLGHYRSKPLLISGSSFHQTGTVRLLTHDGKEEGKIEVGSFVSLVKEANAHDLLAVVLKHQVSPPEVRFYSTESASKFLSASATAGSWEVVDPSKTSKIKAFWMMPYEKYPGCWIGVETYKINVFDTDLKAKQVFTYDKYQFQLAVFHPKSQKGAFFRGDNQFFVIDFKKLDLQGTVPTKPPEEARVSTEVQLLDLQWSNAGDKIAGINNKRELVIWGPDFKEILRTPVIPSIHNLAWSPDDSIIALSADKTTFHYFDVAKKTIVKTLKALGMSHINDIAWDITRNELIIAGDQFVNIFNLDGNPLRKLDFRAESKESIQLSLPACSPTTHEISFLVSITREGDFHYILDLDKPIRECITARLRHHLKGIQFIQWDQPNRIVTMGKSDGLAIWTRK